MRTTFFPFLLMESMIVECSLGSVMAKNDNLDN